MGSASGIASVSALATRCAAECWTMSRPLGSENASGARAAGTHQRTCEIDGFAVPSGGDPRVRVLAPPGPQDAASRGARRDRDVGSVR